MAGITFAAGHAEEINPARRRRGVKFGSRTVDGPVGRAEGQTRIDEPGINRRALHVPNARVGGRRHLFSHGLNETIADDESGAVDDFAGFDHDLAADQRVNTGSNRPMAGRENVRAGNRQREEGDETGPVTPELHRRN